MRRRQTRAVAALVPVALASACGRSSGSGGGTAVEQRNGIQQVTIHTTDEFRFTPATVHAHVGKLRIQLVDDGSYPHNISFPALHATSSSVSGNPGQQQTTLTVSFAHAGTYEFICTFHSSAGMKGRISVS